MTSTAPDLAEIFSDESSFYGDENEQARLEEQVSTYDIEPYWSECHPRLLSTIQNKLRASPIPKSEPSDSAMPDQDTNDPPSRLPLNKRGANESVTSFLARLPPSRTVLPGKDPWIWARGKANLTTNLESRDEATFIRKGTELLRAFEDTLSGLRAAHDKSGAKTTAALTRKLTPLRRELEKNIFALARETGVIVGKWMLFPSPSEVDSTWKTLVTAMDEGTIRADAKVAADTGSGSGQSRLICVYTPDFEDKKDVKEVLLMLQDHGLFEPREGPIFYKCDAYTLLEITSKNEYGLKASMYSSRDLLK
ncbi:uncharacterized protein N7503_007019 [Penicillium pulvis]|uniref:uncharacterized protein n=1 Tax=Penicillium pulvis TaxID=1562058 RepID=UPI002548C3D9|nr:uncharacterized protein N7503_007019 [Penicillium pulvis]KAJ5797723.1 hypothetical protein N7503_007019 [Penicillium pulvis]